ncbi:hypothetical protein BKA56DRAFT_605574 [Ilyonectria sp. MPI-CAGE-AT-0026]|nr:hypothetical protein BKA56DRAFT_605574 [Ilyonectria sp. MPI-CAGE-AT-0026]
MSSQTLRPISAGTWDEAAFVSVLDIIRGHNRELPIAESGVAHQPSQPGHYYGCHQEGPVEAPDLPLGEFWVGELHLSKTAGGSNRKTRGEKRGPIARYTLTGDWNLGRPNLMSIQRATNYIEEN